MIRLGVNIDHVATVRNARGGLHPDPVLAAKLAQDAGVHGITAHLREDRRHISDEDIYELIEKIQLPLNLEMAATGEMLQIALKTKPHAACIVPEKRQEVTTEGGLDVVGLKASLREYTSELAKSGIRVSLFIDADKKQIDAAKELAVPVVELHTGAYAHGIAGELDKLQQAAKYCAELGIECHAGHGLTFNNVAQIAVIPQVIELNIGHFLIGEAIFCGLETAIKKMRGFMDEARGL